MRVNVGLCLMAESGLVLGPDPVYRDDPLNSFHLGHELVQLADVIHRHFQSDFGFIVLDLVRFHLRDIDAGCFAHRTDFSQHSQLV